jgi:hypothetical protein
MITATDILFEIEEKETYKIKDLAKRLEIPIDQLEKVLKNLSQINVAEYDPKKGIVRLSQWLVNLNGEIENIKPATGTIILPKNQTIKLQDVAIGNFTDEDIELNIRLATKQKEIAICKTS